MRIVAIMLWMTLVAWSAGLAVPPGEIPPTLVFAGDKQSLSWSGASGAQAYNVYRGSAADGSDLSCLVFRTPGTSAVDPYVPSQLTTYVVAGWNSSGEGPLGSATGGPPRVPASSCLNSARPNVVFMMTDNQEETSVIHMPYVNSLVKQVGASFENALVSYSLCCPSRSTFLTGLYAHNHGVLGNEPPLGGYTAFDPSDTLAVWLQTAGYYNAHIGKYLNGYGYFDTDPLDGLDKCQEFPVGWDEWYGILGNPALYYDYALNDNGLVVTYGGTNNLPDNCSVDEIRPSLYQTDLLGQLATDFILRRSTATDGKPFFLVLSFGAPHGAVAAPRHQGLFQNETLPQSPSFNEADVSDKPSFIQALPLLTPTVLGNLTDEYRTRLEALQAVDEAVFDVVSMLESTGQMANTVIIFTSDQGRMLGEHRLNGLGWPYEESMQVPLFIRGPSIPAGTVRTQPVANVDFAPTILQLAQASSLQALDGGSLMPLIADSSTVWRTAVLHEGRELADRLYDGVRTSAYAYFEHMDGQVELYDLLADPYQLQSLHASTDPTVLAVKDQLKTLLDALRPCAGYDCWR